jgi:hypothetical protein
MHNPFPLIFDFILGILGHFITLLAGCAATVAWSFTEKRILKRPISFKLEIGILLSFLLFACFQTWRDQYTSSEWRGQRILTLEQEVERKAPDFTGEIGSVGSATWRNQTLIIVAINLENRGGTDSGVHAWKMSVKMDDGTIIQGEAPIPPAKDLNIPLPEVKGGLLFKTDLYLPITTMQPIRAGGATSGWFWSVFPTITQDYLFSHKAVVNVRYSEIVNGKTHELPSRPLERGILFPGLGVTKLQNKH